MDKRIKIITVIISILLVILFINLIVTSQYEFKLNGNSIIKINQSDTWDDPLYIVDKDKNVTISSNLKLNQIGTYKIKYTLKVGFFKKTLIREIEILDDWDIADLSLILSGSNPYTIIEGDNYKDPGYIAYDKNDGNISNLVQVIKNINTNKEGTYTVTYRVKSSNGVTKTVTRKVIVAKNTQIETDPEPTVTPIPTPTPTPTPTITPTPTPTPTPTTSTKFQIDAKNFKAQLSTSNYTKTNDIIITINDSHYAYIILPNNQKTTSNKITYTVTENKTYTFKIYDTAGNHVDYKVKITNIDNVAPTGTCTLTLKDSNSTIVVNASDNVGIKGYKYHYGSTTSSLTTSNTHILTTSATSSQVAIYDKANNVKVITCSVVDNRSGSGTEPINQTSSYTTETYNGKQYAFYKPSATTNAKLPLLIYFPGAAGLSVGLPKYLSSGTKFSYYIAIPITTQDNDFTMNLISYLKSNYYIDSNRVFISGASRGTKSALTIAANNASSFAGAIIVSSYTDTTSTSASRLTSFPMWFFQGTGDSYQMVVNYVNQINNAGGNAKLTSYSGGHDAPLEAFKRSDLTTWIFSNSK